MRQKVQDEIAIRFQLGMIDYEEVYLGPFSFLRTCWRELVSSTAMLAFGACVFLGPRHSPAHSVQTRRVRASAAEAPAFEYASSSSFCGRQVRAHNYVAPRGDRRQCTPCMQAEESDNGFPIRLLSGLLVVAFTVSSLFPLIGAFGNKSSPVVEDRLSKVPIFAVTDESGRPFLSVADDGLENRGYFFIQIDDAKRYLEEVEKRDEKAQVRTIGLDAAEKLIGSRKPKAKDVPERYEIVPDAHEAEVARVITNGEFQRRFGENAVPLFYVDGLALDTPSADKSSLLYPLFFEKEKLDEYLTQLTNKNANSGDSLSQDDVQVIDLTETVRQMRQGSNPRFSNVLLYPIERSILYLRESSE